MLTDYHSHHIIMFIMKLLRRSSQGSAEPYNAMSMNRTKKTNSNMLHKLLKVATRSSRWDRKRVSWVFLHKLLRDEISFMSDGSTFQARSPAMLMSTWYDKVLALTVFYSKLALQADRSQTTDRQHIFWQIANAFVDCKTSIGYR